MWTYPCHLWNNLLGRYPTMPAAQASASNSTPSQRRAGAPRPAARPLTALIALLAFAAFAALAPAPPSRADSELISRSSGDAVVELVDLARAQTPTISYELYLVRPGDTVENIASRFGIRPEPICTLNRLDPSPSLQPGQTLAIPLPEKPAPAPAQPAPEPSSEALVPRYALVAAAAPITRHPSGAPSSQVLYQPAPGARLVVTAQQGDYYGVVMLDGSTGWIPKSALQLTQNTIPPETLETMLQGGRPDVVQEALRYLGTPYKYGGSLPYHVDCSLLVQTAFAARGIQLPRTAAAQYDYGHPVSYSQLLPGDRLFFVNSSGRINHTGIYLGGGRFVHASSRRGCVTVDALSQATYWTRFAGARRL